MNEPRRHSDALRRKVIIFFYLGLLAMVVVALGIGWVSVDWGRVSTPWLRLVVGPALTVGGLALLSWSVRIQYVLGLGTPAPKVSTQRLVTQGPYAYSRNPMTLGALLMYLGIGLWIGSGAVIILTLLIFTGLMMFIYYHETRELTERFGDEYQAYQKRTPFLFPCFRSWKS